MENKEKIVAYIADLLQKGFGQDEIKKRLNAVGWLEEEVDEAYAAALIQNGIPVPDKNAQQISAKKSSTAEVIVNLFSFILLGIFASSLWILLSGVINYFFPDKLAYLDYYSVNSNADSIHYAIASLIIGFPLYWLTLRFWFSRFRSDETKVESKLTKWLTYLVLLVTAIIIVGDLIVVIYNLLQGEITARFFLKALAVIVIAGGIFGFYFLERRKIQYKKDISSNVFKIFGWSVAVFILISIILGFLASGSPATQRKRTFDSTRSNDLQTLANCVDSYANRYGKLPDSLMQLQNDSSFSYCANKKDPETGVDYQYQAIDRRINSSGKIEVEFELCATFSLKSDVNISGGTNESKWYQHEAGLSCDRETAIIETEKISGSVNVYPY